MSVNIIIPPHNEVVREVYWFHSVRPSVRPSARPSVRPSRIRSVAPTVLIGSNSYLYILLSNFRRCVACKVSCPISKFEFWHFFKMCNFDFVLFLLGVWCESLVWVIMGRRRVSQNAGILVVLFYTNEADFHWETKMTRYCTLSHTFLPFRFSAQIVIQWLGRKFSVIQVTKRHRIFIDLQCNDGCPGSCENFRRSVRYDTVS